MTARLPAAPRCRYSLLRPLLLAGLGLAVLFGSLPAAASDEAAPTARSGVDPAPSASSASSASPAPKATPKPKATKKDKKRHPKHEQRRHRGPPTLLERPPFQTQTDEAVWNDCTWASGAMFLAQLSGGGWFPPHATLRAMSGDPDNGGSNMGDLQRGIARMYGITLRYSPSGGDPMGWGELLYRLQWGGGAVLMGGTTRLGSPYDRWSASADTGTYKSSGHAVFITDYRPASGVVWIMDPLGRDGYAGEWTPVRNLMSFAYTDGSGLVMAMATPRSRLPDVNRYRFGRPSLTLSTDGTRVRVRLPLRKASGAVLDRFPVTWKWTHDGGLPIALADPTQPDPETASRDGGSTTRTSKPGTPKPTAAQLRRARQRAAAEEREREQAPLPTPVALISPADEAVLFGDGAPGQAPEALPFPDAPAPVVTSVAPLAVSDRPGAPRPGPDIQVPAEPGEPGRPRASPGSKPKADRKASKERKASKRPAQRGKLWTRIGDGAPTAPARRAGRAYIIALPAPSVGGFWQLQLGMRALDGSRVSGGGPRMPRGRLRNPGDLALELAAPERTAATAGSELAPMILHMASRSGRDLPDDIVLRIIWSGDRRLERRRPQVLVVRPGGSSERDLVLTPPVPTVTGKLRVTVQLLSTRPGGNRTVQVLGLTQLRVVVGPTETISLAIAEPAEIGPPGRPRST